ncbi:hypothetical protein B9Z55_004311 [Caenorhabditis nigoni]|uniref:Saposin A-type domain-containing protein n=1 Tax=Caenorhabditis nigoni TaxID=1611254 RepID=A0A2G5UWN6_9PELO|nr:hypothetical protein B9Z55_004311 [Caenorhabditis nigoni]
MTFPKSLLLIIGFVVQISESQYRQHQPSYPQNYHNQNQNYNAHQQHYHQQQHQQHQHAQHIAQQQKTAAAQHQQYPYNNHPSPNSIKAYQTAYPSVPHASVLNQPTHQICDIPPDLWCDSPQSAQQCGVQRQCDSLRHRRQPIKITLIYEALCPYCQKFIANQLGSVFNQFQGQLILELVPWGNSRIMRDGSFSCNHGQKECDANRLQSCVIDILKVKGALPFIVCFERNIQHYGVEHAMQTCSAFIRSQYRQIRQCYDGPRGIQLQREAAQKTMSTRPNPIVEVPYLLINDYTPSVDMNNLNVLLLPQLLAKWTKLTHKQ